VKVISAHAVEFVEAWKRTALPFNGSEVTFRERATVALPRMLCPFKWQRA
jgi:hypothetical protein